MKVIITGATGMIGHGVLNECLVNSNRDSILLINRRKSGVKHAKVKEFIVPDMVDFSLIEHEFKFYDACFFCLGASSFRSSEEEYYRVTYEITMNFASAFQKHNNNIVFSYISAMGADTTEQSAVMWERIKGKTENALLNFGLKQVYIFRPALTKPDKTSPKRTLMHKLFLPLLTPSYPLLKFLFPKYYTSTQNIAKAMINVSQHPNKTLQFNVEDINNLITQGA